jgi:hypothetical protein
MNCPGCGAGEQKPIVYGLPTGKTFEASERGEVVLGGCVIFGDDPQWQCPSCHLRYRTEDKGERSSGL